MFAFLLVVANPVTLHVSAAASLRETFTAISREFETKHPGVEVELNFAGSQQLAAQISEGEACDVFASADERTIRKLKVPFRIFARNSLVIVASHPLPRLNLQSLAGVTTLILAAPPVPAGGYALQAFDSASKQYGKDWRAKLESKVVSQEQDVRAVLAKVELKEADAGVVYATDAKSAAGKVFTFPIDRRFQPEIVYPIGIPPESTQARLAKSFIDYVASKPGQSILRSAGFLPR